jgi:hypothetical protein
LSLQPFPFFSADFDLRVDFAQLAGGVHFDLLSLEINPPGVISDVKSPTLEI